MHTLNATDNLQNATDQQAFLPLEQVGRSVLREMPMHYYYQTVILRYWSLKGELFLKFKTQVRKLITHYMIHI